MDAIRGPEPASRSLMGEVKAHVVRAAMRLQGYVLRASGGVFAHPMPVPLTPESQSGTPPGSILVIRVDEIGDVTLTSPFLAGLRRHYPVAHITLLVKEEVRELVLRCPHVNEVISVRNTCGRLKRWFVLPWAMRSFARAQLVQRRFDMTIQPRWDVDAHYASVLAYHSGSPVRIGFSESVHPRKMVLNAGFDRFFTHTLRDDAPRHEVERSMILLRQMGGGTVQDPLGLWVSEEDVAAVATILESAGVPRNARLVAIAPGAGRPRREWGAGSFAAVGAWLAGLSPETFVVVIGGPRDVRLAREVADAIGPRAVALAGMTSLRQTGALFQRCELLIGNDSGPIHLASAAGIPVVVVSCHPRNGAPMDVQSPTRFGPWSAMARVLQPERGAEMCVESCAARTTHCILQVSVHEVKNAILDVAGARLSATGPGNRENSSEVHRR